MMKKALFLDIDGVLNSSTSDTGWIDPILSDRLARIVYATKADIVISSSWGSMGLSWLKAKWDEWILPSMPIDIIPNVSLDEAIAMVPDESDIVIGKGLSIKKWLTEHPDYITYAIVDDFPVVLPEQEPYFVRTDNNVGLTDVDVERIIALLN